MAWVNSWGDDPPPQDNPDDQPPPDDFNQSPDYSSANAGDVPYDPFASAAAHNTRDQDAGQPYPGAGQTLPNYTPQPDANNAPQPYDHSQDQFAASDFEYNPSPQQTGVLPARPLQDYHDQLMDEIVNGNLNAQPQDDGTWLVSPKAPDQPAPPPDYNQLLSNNGNTGDVPYDPAAAAQKYYESWAQMNSGDVPFDPYASAADEISKLYPQPDLTPTDQDANTPGVTQANTLLGKLQQARFNPDDPTAGNVAQDATSKLLEASALSLGSIALSEAALNPELNVGATANLFGKSFSVTSNSLARWAADMAIRTGVSQVIGDKAKNLPGPLPNVLSMFPYTIGSSGLLGSLENAGVLGTALYGVDKTNLPTGPAVPVFGNARDFLTMFLVGGFKGALDEHVKAGQAAQMGQKPALPTEAESGFKFNDDGTVVLDRFGRRPMNIDLQTMKDNYASYESLLSTKQKAYMEAQGNLSRTRIQLPDDVYTKLNQVHQAVINADPSDLVTVYHGTDPASAENIYHNGLDKDSWLTTDPEMAGLHTMNRGDKSPQVLSFTVPRDSLRQSGPFFQANDVLEANSVRVPDAKGTVTTWLNAWEPASGETAQPVPVTNTGAVEDLAFGASGQTAESTGMRTTSEVANEGRLVSQRDMDANMRAASLERVRALYNAQVMPAYTSADGKISWEDHVAAVNMPEYRRWGEELYRRTDGKEGLRPSAPSGPSGITNTAFQGAEQAGIRTDKIKPTEGIVGKGWVGPDGQAYEFKDTHDLHVDTVTPGTWQKAGVDRAMDNGWARVERSSYGVNVQATTLSGVEKAVYAAAKSPNEHLTVDLNIPVTKEGITTYKGASWSGNMKDWLNSTPRVRGSNITLTANEGGAGITNTGYITPDGRSVFVDLFKGAAQGAKAQLDKLNGLKEQINGGATTTNVIKDYLQTRSDLLTSLTDASQHGTELAKSGGDGLTNAMGQAIKQFLADEEGSLRLPQRTPDGKYVISDASYPLTDTMLGTDPINPHLSKAQEMVNVAKDLTGKGVFNDPLAQGIRSFKLKARSVMSNMGANIKNQILSRGSDAFKFNKDGTVSIDMGTPSTPATGSRLPQIGDDIPGVGRVRAVTRVTINGETKVRVSAENPAAGAYSPELAKQYPRPASTPGAGMQWFQDSTGRWSPQVFAKTYYLDVPTTSISPAKVGDVHLQTIAADYANWAPLLSDKQRAFLEWSRDAIKPIDTAYQEIGLDHGLRPDIKPGGFYLPRGDAMTEAWAQDQGHVPTRKNRGVKPGSEKPTHFDSMEDATSKGYTYMPFHEAMQNYVETTGRRLADARVTQALKGAVDENGTPLAQTPEAIVLSNNPALKQRMDTLKGWVSSLTAAVTGLDQRSRDVMEKFVASPAINDADWQALNDTVAAMYTKGGDLRVRSSQGPAPDIRGNARMLRQQIRDTLTQVRGQYAGLSIPEAKRLATQQTLQDLNISRGRFKGMDAETAKNTLAAVKDTIKNLKPEYDANVRTVRTNVGKGLEPTSFGAQLRDYQFPERLANDLNRGLVADQAKNGNVFSLTNNLLRAARLTGDLATITTHGTIALFNTIYNPMMAARVLKTTVASTLDKAAQGDYLRDFDAKRAKDNNPNSTQWVQANAHVGEGGTGIVGLNRVYGAGTTAWRMELNNAAWDKSYNNLPEAEKIQKMREIAATNNLVTGYAPTGFGGPGQALLLAPRLIQSQIDLLMKGLDPHGGITGVGGARQKLLTYFGVAAALTVAANESGVFGPPPGFNYLSPTVNGKLNPDFMRIFAGGKVGKVSLLGAYDWMFKAVGAASQGDLSYFPRTKAGPMGSMAWDLITGRDFLGHPIGFSIHDVKGTDPSRIAPWLASSVLPIAPSEGVGAVIRGETGAGPKVSLGAAAAQTLITETGIKHTAPTASAEFNGLRDQTLSKMKGDGRIPADVADLIKDTPYGELPLGLQKQVDQAIKTDDPQDYQWYHTQRLDEGNLYEEKKAAADDQRTKYAAKFDDLNNDLKAGVDPYIVWNAFETDKNQRTGALAALYDDKAYQNAVNNLPASDMRTLEAAYDNILFGAGQKAIEKFTADDWTRVQNAQQVYMTELQRDHPDQATLLQYSLDQRDKLGLENGTALEQLKKQANTTLQPYYQLVEAEKAGTAPVGGSLKWLNQNPDADYLHWLTEKPLTEGTVPKLHSAAALNQAVAAYGDTPRAVELVGSKEPVSAKDLPILQKYAKQITQITTLPGKATDPDTGKEYSPVQRLRQQDPVYDALYTWLYATPQKDKSGRSYVVMYHADYVNQFLSQVGGRADKVKPRTSGNQYAF